MKKGFSLIQKSGLVSIVAGILLAAFFAFADRFGFGKGGSIGAAQLLGIEIGITLALLGLGLVITDWSEASALRVDWRSWLTKILDLSPTFWVVSTFIVLYLAFFIPTMFFSKLSIQYFVKYIPDAFITHIGFDIEQTVSHIGAWLTDGVSPYADRIVPYSPFALAVFTPFLVIGYPAYFELLVAITLATFFVAALFIPLQLAPKQNRAILVLIFVVTLFSYGLQFELERGQFNVLAFASVLVAIYIFHYQPKFRYFAYLLFSFGVQLKLYPAIFILMLVDNWHDWKTNLKRFTALSLLNFALLFVLGVPLAREFISHIFSRQAGLQSSRIEDLSISGYAYSVTNEIMPRLAPYDNLIQKLFLLVFAACLFYIIAHAFAKKQGGFNIYLFAVSTIGALIIPAASFDYKLSILAAPVMLILCTLPAFETVRKKIISIVCVIFLSAAYWSTLYPYQVKPAFMAHNFPALMLILFSVIVLHSLTRGHAEIQT